MKHLVLSGLAAIALLGPCIPAWADDRCGAIRTAEAIGIIKEHAEAGDNLPTNDSKSPYVGYDVIRAKSGDTLGALAKPTGAFSSEYESSLIQVLNPSL